MPRTRNPRGEGERLRDDIIEAASRLLLAPEDPGPLSLRGVAREVGIAAQSMYLHFADKRELVWAVIERRYGELAARLDQAAADAPSARTALRARCVAYCRFGLERPGHYQLLFESRATGLLGVPYGGSPGAAVFDSLRRAVQAAAAVPDAMTRATDLWVGLHGIVGLRISKPGFPWPDLDGQVDRLLARLGLAGA